MGRKVFISYRHQQAEWVRTTLYPVLAAGGAEVVIDYREFAAGLAVRRQMKAAQDKADLHLLVFTPDYFQSDYCVEEMRRAFALDPDFSKGLVLPVLLERCDLPPEIQQHQPLYVDLTGNRQQDADAWSLLMNRCEADLGATVPNWTSVPDATPLGLMTPQPHTQGSSFLATLGGRTQSLWDCGSVGLPCVQPRFSFGWNCRKATGLRAMPFGNSAPQSRRDFTKIARRFNAGLGAYGEPSPGGAKEIPVPPPQSAVPDGTGGRCPPGPSVETLGYSQPSLRDATCEPGWMSFRKPSGLRAGQSTGA